MKTVLVTGATSGIGEACARKFAQNGYDIIACGRNNTKLADLKKELEEQYGGAVHTLCFDICNEKDVHDFMDVCLGQYPPVDILVNNAGITRDKLLMAMGEDDFVSVLNTNLLGSFHTIKFLIRNFLKLKGGSIINISSVSGIIGNPGQANYSSSKAGVIGLTKSVAREYASKGIRVNAIAPGFVDTDMVDNMTDEAKKQIEDKVPLRRLGKPSEIAELAAFLASDRASYITGQVISVDGGMSM